MEIDASKQGWRARSLRFKIDGQSLSVTVEE